MLDQLSREVKEELLNALLSEMEDQDAMGMEGDGMAIVSEEKVIPAEDAMDEVKEKMDVAMGGDGMPDEEYEEEDETGVISRLKRSMG